VVRPGRGHEALRVRSLCRRRPRSRRARDAPDDARSRERRDQGGDPGYHPHPLLLQPRHPGEAAAYYHWFFLIRPEPFPETLINNSVETYVGAGNGEPQAEFLRAFKNRATVHAMCEDYRAGATIDFQHDEADLNRKIACPLLVWWGEKGNVGSLFDPLAVWRERASDVRGRSMPSGHNIQLEASEQLLAELHNFLRA